LPSLDATDPAAGFSLEACDPKKDCPEIKLDVEVPPESQEDNPGDKNVGAPHKEQLWVNYFTTAGDLNGDTRLIYYATDGRVTDSEEPFTRPRETKDGLIFVVLRDNRSGADWRIIPFHAQ